MKKLAVLFISLVAAFSLLPVSQAAAWELSDEDLVTINDHCSSYTSLPAQQSCIAQCKLDPTPCLTEQKLENDVRNVINMVFFLIGIITVGMIIMGGFFYASAQGEEAKIKRGKDTILYGVIGLIIVLLSFAIVNFVLNSLGTPDTPDTADVSADAGED